MGMHHNQAKLLTHEGLAILRCLWGILANCIALIPQQKLTILFQMEPPPLQPHIVARRLASWSLTCLRSLIVPTARLHTTGSHRLLAYRGFYERHKQHSAPLHHISKLFGLSYAVLKCVSQAVIISGESGSGVTFCN